MLDIKFIRESTQVVKDNMRQKNRTDLDIVDRVIVLDAQFRVLSAESQKLRARRNSASQQINLDKKAGRDISGLLAEIAQIPSEIAAFDKQLLDVEVEMLSLQKKIPVIMHPSVPIGKSDKENVQVAVYGDVIPKDFDVVAHQEIAKKLGVADFDSAATVAGNGFYYLQGDLALLNQAILQYAIQIMVKRGFTYVETPYMLRGEIISKVVSLDDQENQVYKISDEDLYLIGTSEHALIGRYLNTTVSEKDLPIKQTSYSMCFRREKGSHGLDERGLYRTHQFNKIEMIVICKPEESMQIYNELQQITIDVFTGLGLPIRVLAICSGDLGDLKHVQVDIEAYSPRRKDYFEVGSCSNLVDAQARQLGIKIDTKEGKILAHTLNNTAIATSRALVAILENSQTKDGKVKIPQVLQAYMGGKEYLG